MNVFGSCQCCGDWGITTPADSRDGICGTCRSRPLAACQKTHAKETAP